MAVCWKPGQRTVIPHPQRTARLDERFSRGTLAVVNYK